MLVEFKVSNYRSFKEQQTLSMVASSEKNLNDHTISLRIMGAKRLVRSAVIYGPNASGKSNLIRALHFVKDFVTRSVDLRLTKISSYSPFIFDDTAKNSPSEFETTFIHKNVRYQYGFVVDHHRVHEEWLIAYPKRSAQIWYERTYDQQTEDYKWYFGPLLKGEKNKLIPLTRANTLFLSLAAQFNHEQLSNIHEWFTRHLQVGFMNEHNSIFELITSQMVIKNQTLHRKIRNLLSIADLGIVDFKIKESSFTSQEIDYSDEAPSELRELLKGLSDLTKDSKRIEVLMHHSTGDSIRGSVPLEINEESMGTRRIFSLAGPIFEALEDGDVLVVDELDASLHPIIVKALVRLFNDPETNPNNAQLIFNSHDTTLLDSDVFRRDQIWFVEKAQNGSSFLFSLLDFNVRSTEVFSRGYLQGKYGAIPILGDLTGFADYAEEA